MDIVKIKNSIYNFLLIIITPPLPTNEFFKEHELKEPLIKK